MPLKPARLNRRDVLLGGLAAGLTFPGRGWAEVPARPVADPALAGIADQVLAQKLRDTVTGLASFPTRWTLSPNFDAVEDWVADAFSTGSATPWPVTRQAYQMPMGPGRHNILCGNPRTGREVILVGAHMDSISERPDLLAPGANDNATGIAALMECHRILSQYRFEREIVLIAFSGEEQGLRGASACSDIAVAEGWPIELMFNLDMLGFRPERADTPIIIEFDQGNRIRENDAPAARYAAMAAEVTAAHTTLSVAHTDIWNSDYMPFESAGFTCIGIYDDGAEGPFYHRSTDTPEQVDFDRLEQVVRLVVVTTAIAAGLIA